MKRPEQKLKIFLKERGLTIAFAESMTCGMAEHKLGTVSDTSNVFIGSIVCYNEKVKTNLLSVSRQLIKKSTAESQEVTDALAKNLRTLIKADIYAAVTGLAAPGGTETKQKPVGTVFYSVFYKGKLFKRRTLFKGSPLEIRKKACDELYKFIILKLK